MARKPPENTETSEFAIFARLLSDHKAEMSPRLARYVLTLGFSDAEQARMEDLAQRNQSGGLSLDEHDALMNYVKASHWLALLHSKARKALQKRKVS
jgi:hypothetical protein